MTRTAGGEAAKVLNALEDPGTCESLVDEICDGWYLHRRSAQVDFGPLPAPSWHP
jgi:hypothetical protein